MTTSEPVNADGPVVDPDFDAALLALASLAFDDGNSPEADEAFKDL